MKRHSAPPTRRQRLFALRPRAARVALGGPRRQSAIHVSCRVGGGAVPLPTVLPSTLAASVASAGPVFGGVVGDGCAAAAAIAAAAGAAAAAIATADGGYATAADARRAPALAAGETSRCLPHHNGPPFVAAAHEARRSALRWPRTPASSDAVDCSGAVWRTPTETYGGPSFGGTPAPKRQARTRQQQGGVAGAAAAAAASWLRTAIPALVASRGLESRVCYAITHSAARGRRRRSMTSPSRPRRHQRWAALASPPAIRGTNSAFGRYTLEMAPLDGCGCTVAHEIQG